MSELPPKSSIKRWFLTTNHKDIGVLYLLTALFFLVFGGLLALLFRVELLARRRLPSAKAATTRRSPPTDS